MTEQQFLKEIEELRGINDLMTKKLQAIETKLNHVKRVNKRRGLSN